MAYNKEKADAPMKRRGGMRRRKKVCVFCGEENAVIDFKDTAKLRKYVSERGKILPRRITGKGKAIVDGMEQVLRNGDVITIAAGCKHTVEAITPLDMIEVQLGDEISVTDKIKFELD